MEISESEIDKVIEKKLIEYEIRWLYTDSKQSIEDYFIELRNIEFI